MAYSVAMKEHVTKYCFDNAEEAIIHNQHTASELANDPVLRGWKVGSVYYDSGAWHYEVLG